MLHLNFVTTNQASQGGCVRFGLSTENSLRRAARSLKMMFASFVYVVPQMRDTKQSLLSSEDVRSKVLLRDDTDLKGGNLKVEDAEGSL
jgi:hypothetical protein